MRGLSRTILIRTLKNLACQTPSWTMHRKELYYKPATLCASFSILETLTFDQIPIIISKIKSKGELTPGGLNHHHFNLFVPEIWWRREWGGLIWYSRALRGSVFFRPGTPRGPNAYGWSFSLAVNDLTNWFTSLLPCFPWTYLQHDNACCWRPTQTRFIWSEQLSSPLLPVANKLDNQPDKPSSSLSVKRSLNPQATEIV